MMDLGNNGRRCTICGKKRWAERIFFRNLEDTLCVKCFFWMMENLLGW